MNRPILARTVGEMHYRDLLREAEVERLARRAMAGRPGLRDRLLVRAADSLISLGLRLKKRYQAIGQEANLPVLQAS